MTTFPNLCDYVSDGLDEQLLVLVGHDLLIRFTGETPAHPAILCVP